MFLFHFCFSFLIINYEAYQIGWGYLLWFGHSNVVKVFISKITPIDFTVKGINII